MLGILSYASRFCRRDKNRRGATMLEFALVGPFFIFFIAVAMDLGLTLMTQTVLNNAARDAARLILTNQTGGTPQTFKRTVCNELNGLVPCASLQYYVQSAGSFAAMSSSTTTDSNGNLQNNGTFNPGAPGQYVVVQVAYNRPTLVPWALNYVGGHGAQVSRASTLVIATLAFKNEP